MGQLASARSMQNHIYRELCQRSRVIKFVVGKLCADIFFNPCMLIFTIILSYLLNILCWWIVMCILYRNVHWNALLYVMTTTLLFCIFHVVMQVVWQFPHASYFIDTSTVSFQEVIVRSGLSIIFHLVTCGCGHKRVPYMCVKYLILPTRKWSRILNV
mgnify:CR=1 FL=1